jgi:murein DD-endopeptidase MepM/ murein hydrolase activator NlpD
MLKTRLALAALLAAAAALIVLLAASSAAPAQDLESKLDAKEAKLSKVRERKGVLTATISGLGDKIDRLTGEVATLRNHEAAVRVRLDAKQGELDRAEAQLDVAKKRLLVMRAHLKRALVSLRHRLVAIYETGTPDVLSVLIGSNGYDDLIDRTEYLNRIHGMDEAVVGRVRDLRDQVRRTVTRLRAAKNTIETARAAVQRRQSALLSARSERLAALREIRKHEEELDGSVAAIQGKIAARLAGTGSVPLPAGPIQGGSGSGLIWPVSGPVVSGFGSRTINGSYEYHPGIDIAVASGTPIRAAAAGTVIFTEPEASSGGYGNYTCIDHGGGLSTCYAHQETFAVSAGQQVSQGQIIGYSDCTGYCFGPHLHFEVRIGGEVTDGLSVGHPSTHYSDSSENQILGMSGWFHPANLGSNRPNGGSRWFARLIPTSPVPSRARL